jgi:hypothetical protein
MSFLCGSLCQPELNECLRGSLCNKNKDFHRVTQRRHRVTQSEKNEGEMQLNISKKNVGLYKVKSNTYLKILIYENDSGL